MTEETKENESTSVLLRFEKLPDGGMKLTSPDIPGLDMKSAFPNELVRLVGDSIDKLVRSDQPRHLVDNIIEHKKAHPRKRPEARPTRKLKNKGIMPFFMVAAAPAPEGVALNVEDEEAYQPHVRHYSHQAALWQAHKMARRIGCPMVVLGPAGLAMPPKDEES